MIKIIPFGWVLISEKELSEKMANMAVNGYNKACFDIERGRKR